MPLYNPQTSTTPFVPYFIASGTTYEVPEFYQALFEMNIVVDGEIIIDGFLVEI